MYHLQEPTFPSLCVQGGQQHVGGRGRTGSPALRAIIASLLPAATQQRCQELAQPELPALLRAGRQAAALPGGAGTPGEEQTDDCSLKRMAQGKCLSLQQQHSKSLQSHRASLLIYPKLCTGLLTVGRGCRKLPLLWDLLGALLHQGKQRRAEAVRLSEAVLGLMELLAACVCVCLCACTHTAM